MSILSNFEMKKTQETIAGQFYREFDAWVYEWVSNPHNDRRGIPYDRLTEGLKLMDDVLDVGMLLIPDVVPMDDGSVNGELVVKYYRTHKQNSEDNMIATVTCKVNCGYVFVEFVHTLLGPC